MAPENPAVLRRLQAETELERVAKLTGLKIRPHVLTAPVNGKGEVVIGCTIGGWLTPFYVEYVEYDTPLGTKSTCFDVLSLETGGDKPTDPPVDTDPFISTPYLRVAIHGMASLALGKYLMQKAA